MNTLILDIVNNMSLVRDEKLLLLSFIEVETGGEGFDVKTGKILIQFEPSWFRKKAPYAPSGKWSVNKVDVQAKEWIAFNDAFAKNKEAAMESTSIGLGQIMGFNYKLLGYKAVGDMWDDAKRGLYKQVEQMWKFISNNKKLYRAMLAHNWHLMAIYYNGEGYMQIAKKYKRTPYNIALERAYDKWRKII